MNVCDPTLIGEQKTQIQNFHIHRPVWHNQRVIHTSKYKAEVRKFPLVPLAGKPCMPYKDILDPISVIRLN